ncbi:MAG: hypothetical protein JNK37_20155 [Verrucomicrobiales bacterium]|nr:hypothetical protein [Verrucomicrobiales bacterium]
MKAPSCLATLLCLTGILAQANGQTPAPAAQPAAPGTPAVPGAPGTPPPASFTRNRVVTLMPDDKRALVLKPEERNPFARRNPDVDLITENSEQETEADLIRDMLMALPITGRSYGPKGLRVLAGEIIFERGKLVDQVIEDQTENLIVENVKDNAIELAWIDLETGKLTGKRLILPYDLSPKVHFVLKGQTESEEDSETIRFGVFRPNGPAAPNADQIAADKRPNNIPVEAFTEGQ